MARQRAGLTQQQLAARSGYPRVSLARWENGTREPSLRTVRDVVRAAGLDLTLGLVARDDSLLVQARDQLTLAPAQRLANLLGPDELAAARTGLTWAAGRKDAIVVGHIAAALEGAPQQPPGAEVELTASDPDVITRDLERDGWVPDDDPRRYTDADRRWAWQRDDATITIASALPGTHRDYADLRRHARQLDLDEHRTVCVAHPRDLLRIAEASNDPQTRTRVGGLRAVVDLAHENP